MYLSSRYRCALILLQLFTVTLLVLAKDAKDGDYDGSDYEHSDSVEYKSDDSQHDDGYKSYYDYNDHHYGYKPKKKKVYVPVFVPEEEKKKMKILRVDKGFHVVGGMQLFGKFKSLKHCMKACAKSPTCYSGDYNPWLHKCYQHSNATTCDTVKSHPQFVHFSKVPCAVVDAPTGHVTLGANMANGIEQKGIDTLQQCIKKCAAAGLGIPATASSHVSFHTQGCFAIDYDFATHRCYFFATNVLQLFTSNNDMNDPMIAPVPAFIHCIIAAGVPQPASLGLRANPTVIHITFCPAPTAA